MEGSLRGNLWVVDQEGKSLPRQELSHQGGITRVQRPLERPLSGHHMPLFQGGAEQSRDRSPVNQCRQEVGLSGVGPQAHGQVQDRPDHRIFGRLESAPHNKQREQQADTQSCHVDTW